MVCSLPEWTVDRWNHNNSTSWSDLNRYEIKNDSKRLLKLNAYIAIASCCGQLINSQGWIITTWVNENPIRLQVTDDRNEKFQVLRVDVLLKLLMCWAFTTVLLRNNDVGFGEYFSLSVKGWTGGEHAWTPWDALGTAWPLPKPWKPPGEPGLSCPRHKRRIETRNFCRNACVYCTLCGRPYVQTHTHSPAAADAAWASAVGLIELLEPLASAPLSSAVSGAAYRRGDMWVTSPPPQGGTMSDSMPALRFLTFKECPPGAPCYCVTKQTGPDKCWSRPLGKDEEPPPGKGHGYVACCLFFFLCVRISLQIQTELFWW